MNGFIVRPFGVKSGIDFDKVERDLIAPALERLNVTGRTTGDIAAAGNIRADMFHLLLTADVVVADMSIHNANVFYELGVRHALRDKWTVLLRASIDEVPFDLKTDRYLAYDAANPGAALDALIAALSQTCRNNNPDSPVYSMIPGLKAPDPASFIVVPEDFREEARRAAQKAECGDLRFLASELTDLRWRREGLRITGEAQFTLGDRAFAAETWEAVRAELPHDLQANLRLGTLHQKLGDLVLSDEALERVVGLKDLKQADLAEARALLGSNQKTRWYDDWSKASAENRPAEALRSGFLLSSLAEYQRGFEADPSHFYSGLNALALVTILTELAAALPEVWNERFTDEEEAGFKLRECKNLRAQLTGAVDFALRAAKQRLAREERQDPWVAVGIADHAFLCAKPNTAALYRDALKSLGPFAAGSVGRQFQMFRQLNLLEKMTAAAAPVFNVAVPATEQAKPVRVLLFTGHRVDAPGRSSPRFPAPMEPAARKAIREAIEREFASGDGAVIAISGAASGGDLLFLEVCEELKMERHVYLIIPRDDYVKASVAPAGPDWIRRFDHQRETAAKTREYQRSAELPDWLKDRPDANIWKCSNSWMLYNALALGGTRTTLIALWDGRGGDGPGGTEDMVKTAGQRGARTIVLDTNELFGLSAKSGA